MRIRLRAMLLALAAILCLHNSASAQKPIAIGFTVGLNDATEDYRIDSDTSRSTRQGLIICGQTDWPLYGTAVLQDRLSYIQKGVTATRQEPLLQAPSTIRTELNYVELSLCPKVKFGTYDFKPYFFLGPRVGLLVAGNQITEQGNQTTTEDFRTNYNALDFGLDMGAGFSYPVIPKLYFIGDLSYSWGLSNVLKNSVANSPEAYSRDLKVQAGFLLEIYDVTHD